jgi:hypothetical protein
MVYIFIFTKEHPRLIWSLSLEMSGLYLIKSKGYLTSNLNPQFKIWWSGQVLLPGLNLEENGAPGHHGRQHEGDCTLVPSSTQKPQQVVRGWPEHYPNVIR